MGYDLFVGIDWTGAQPARAVAVAACDPGGLVRPVWPAGRYWGRREAADWIAVQVRGGARVLAGFDFGFAMPWVEGVGYLDGRVPDVTDMVALWDLVEQAGGQGEDHFAGAAVADPRLAPSFWIDGPMPAHWGDGSTKRRRVEIVAAQTGAGTPVSLFKLAAASKQVGKASLAGMRTLRYLRGLLGDRLAVWPVEMPAAGQSVVMEIYPTLFRKQALGGVRKITGRAAMEAAVAHFGCTLSHEVPEQFDDHIGDAIITAAGLSRLAGNASAWAPVGLTADIAGREGWIFGVGVS
ncbi:hypothetical protein [Niveispirillum sp. KHB5.9]|uniref:hypothetical protein n=1 Tax=Niveispirillum sp. KHB5.9 TaxID=3400269 RepID=UPI003A84C066